jgi:hypothetical protein
MVEVVIEVLLTELLALGMRELLIKLLAWFSGRGQAWI